MSGTFPSTVGFETLDFQSNTTTRVTVSVSGKTQRLKVGGQFWSFKLKSPSMTRANMMADYAFLVQQNGQYEAFTIVPPEIATTRGTVSGTITVANTTSTTPAISLAAGSTAVGTTISDGGVLKKGDLIKFSNHNKIYMVTEDVNFDGSTLTRVPFYPPLTTALTGGGQTITYTNVPFTVFLDNDQIKFITQADGTYKYEITVNEEI